MKRSVSLTTIPSPASIHTGYSLFYSDDTIRSWIPRCQYPIAVVPGKSHAISDLLGGLVLYLVDHNKMRHRPHVCPNRCPTTNHHPYLYQHGNHDHHNHPRLGLCLCQLYAICCDLESCFVHLPIRFWPARFSVYND